MNLVYRCSRKCIFFSYGIAMKVRVVGILCVSEAIFISISDDLILRDNLHVN